MNIVATIQTAGQLQKWVQHASPGETAIYWTGFLAVARDSNLGGDLPIAAMSVNALATAALDEWYRGTVDLTQRRLGSGRYEYLVTRRARVEPRERWGDIDLAPAASG